MSKTQKRDRAWLFRYLNRKPADTMRVRGYIKAISESGGQLDLSDPGKGEDNRVVACGNSRGGAAELGRLAFVYRTKGTPQHKDPAVLQTVLDGLRRFEQQQDERGRFIWGDGYYYQFGPHEHGWRFEPLLFARVWLDDYLTDKDKRWIDRMLKRASKYFLTCIRDTPASSLQFNNRGLVWAATTQLCGLYFEDERFFNAVDKHVDPILNAVIDEQGQVKEATLQYMRGGPDTNYTYTGWTYVQMYRLFSGRTDIDEKLLNAVRWLVKYATRSGHSIVAGASVRWAKYPVGKIADACHALSFYSDREPYLNHVLDEWWPIVQKQGGHCVHGSVWTLLDQSNRTPAQKKRNRTTSKKPDWIDGFEGHYNNYATQYMLFHHAYQSGVTLRGNQGLCGLQSFAYGGEVPFVLHTLEEANSTRIGSVDTARDSVDGTNKGPAAFIREANAPIGFASPIDRSTIQTMRSGVWELYAFTPESVICIIGGRKGQLKTRWLLNPIDETDLKLSKTKKQITSTHREAQLQWRGYDAARYKTLDERAELRLAAKAGPVAWVLSGSSFKWKTFDSRKGITTFEDASGKYELNFDRMTDDGKLMYTGNWHRITQLA